MKVLNLIKCSLFLLVVGMTTSFISPNQTNTLSPILPEADLPFRIVLKQIPLSLPNGTHSGVFAIHKGKWLFFAGQKNGLHGFNADNNNFPPQQMNNVVYVVDLKKNKTYSRSLNDPSSGLTQHQVDLLSVSGPQYHQKENTLYMTGGYGVDTATGLFSTKDVLTAVDIEGLMHWVTHPLSNETAAQNIRQISDPIFKVTGGYMSQIGSGPFLLVFGQNFQGFYTDGSSGIYSEQVRRFNIHDHDGDLTVTILTSKPEIPNPNYRRRDLNVVPTMKKEGDRVVEGLTAFSGVFTLASGIWTVPVEITKNGDSFMQDPNSSSAFKQGMNNYVCPTIELFSKRTGDMYVSFLGGISYEYISNSAILTDSEFPFVNLVTTVKRDRDDNYTQYLMSGQYPMILSTQSNPGNPLLFGASGYFVRSNGVPMYSNHVIKLDSVGKKPFVAGYVVGGIQSTLGNTNFMSDSGASPYIFKVTIVPVKK